MSRILAAAILCLASTVLVSGQPRPGTTGTQPPSMAPPETLQSGSAPLGSLFISGKVALDDGTMLPDRAAIQTICKGRTHIEGYTDSRGLFSFQVTNPGHDEGIDSPEDASDSSITMRAHPSVDPGLQGSNPLRNYYKECQLQAALPGFSSGVIELSSKFMDVGNSDVGTLILHRMRQVQGLTISITTAQAPSKAKRQFEKGRNLEKKQKWDAAVECFHKAVEEYPKYAIAWFEMGQIQEEKNDSMAAQKSFEQALSADPNFVSPYHELAKMAARQQQWSDMVAMTDKLLKLNPVDFPQDWLLNAIGNFYLKNFVAAEKSASHGLEADKQRQFPRLEYLLGMALYQRHDYANAMVHIRNYVRLAPHASDAQAIQKQADEIERLSSQSVRN
jgi:tetratricopeptide (TPR) repeat protein